MQTSFERTDGRYRADHEEYRNGEGLGGRYIPSKVIEGQIDRNHEWSSQNRATFEAVKLSFDRWQVIDNSGKEPRVVETGRR